MSLLLLLLAFQDPPVPLKNGRYRGDIVDPATKEVIMKVRMQVPDKLPAVKTLGFIFVCHGFKGHENNSYLDGTVAALKRKGIDGQYLVVAGKSKGEGWTEEDDDRFLKLYAWAKQNYPVDPKRLFLFGSSNGARFVNRFGAAHQDIVNGVVSYCGSFDLSKMVEPAEKKTEWYYVHGGKDRPENSRRMCDELKKRGYRYVFRMLDGYGHTDIWDGKGHPDTSVVEAVCDDWAEWLHTLPRKPVDATADLTLLEPAARWRQPKAQDDLCARAKTRDLAAVDALGRVARLMLLGNFEDKAVIWTLVRLLEDEDLKIRQAAFAALEKAAPGGLEYRPDLPSAERPAAVARWTEWCTAKCGPEK